MTTRESQTMSTSTTTAQTGDAAIPADGQNPAQDGLEVAPGTGGPFQPQDGAQAGADDLAQDGGDRPDTDALVEAANRGMTQVGRSTPLARLLADAGAVQADTRGRLVALRYSGQAHTAASVTAEAEHHLAILRDRALTAAATTLEAEAARLCGVGGPTTRLTPDDLHQIASDARAALADVHDDATCTRALGTALRQARSPHGLGVAGAIARHALEHDLGDALALWTQPGAPGGERYRGGAATVASWRGARAIRRALEAGVWPSPLADAPTLEDVPR